MVNAFVEFVKEYRKKHTNLSYKEAMVEASKVYKKKDGSKSTPKSTPKKKGGSLIGGEDGEYKGGSEVGGSMVGGSIDKKQRNKDIREYKKVLSDINSDIKEGRKNTETIDKFYALANRLKGSSEKNTYAKAIKRIKKKLESKSFEKKNKSLSLRQSKLKDIKDRQLKKNITAMDDSEYTKEQNKMNRMRKRTAELIRRKKAEFSKGKITAQQLRDYLDRVSDIVEDEEKKTDDIGKTLKALDDKINSGSLSNVSNVRKGRTAVNRKNNITISIEPTEKDNSTKKEPVDKKTKSAEAFINKYKGKTGFQLLEVLRSGKQRNNRQVIAGIRIGEKLIEKKPDADISDILLLMNDAKDNYQDYLATNIALKVKPARPVKPTIAPKKVKPTIAPKPTASKGGGKKAVASISPSLRQKLDDYAFDTTTEKELIEGFITGDLAKMSNGGLKIGSNSLNAKNIILRLRSALKGGGDGEITNHINELISALNKADKGEKVVSFNKDNEPVFAQKGSIISTPPITASIVKVDDSNSGDIADYLAELESMKEKVYNNAIDGGASPNDAYQDMIDYLEDVKDKKTFINSDTQQKYDFNDLTGDDFDEFINIEIRDAQDKQDTASVSSSIGAGFWMKGKEPKEVLEKDMDGGSLSSRIMEHFAKKDNKLVKSVDDKDVLSLKISNASYKKPNKRTDIDGYSPVQDLSSAEAVVYKNDEKKQIIIGFRGSVNFKDFKTDIRLAVGGITKTERYESSVNLVKKVIEMFPNYTIGFTGHSLGGTLAIEMNLITPSRRAVSFNAGHTPLRRKATNDNDITYYTNKGDLVSGLGMKSYRDVKVLDNEHKNPLIAHSLARFNEVKGDEEDYQGGSFKLLKGVKHKVKKLTSLMIVKNNLVKIQGDIPLVEKLKLSKEIFAEADKITDAPVRRKMLNVGENLIAIFSR